MIPVYVISLRRAEARRESVRAGLDALKIPFTFLDAIDGVALTEDEALRLCPKRFSLVNHRPLSKTQIAAAESHARALQVVLDSNAAFACVMEDDARPEADTAEFLDEAFLLTLPSFDVMKLGSDWANPRDALALPIAAHAERCICVPLHPTYSTVSYLVSRAGAARLLRHTREQQNTVDVNFFRCPAWNARILDVRPSVVLPSGATSTINSDPSLQAPIPRRRRIGVWFRRRLNQWERKVRQYVAFINGQGVGALMRVKMIPLHRPRP